jgi:hypothetical protein
MESGSDYPIAQIRLAQLARGRVDRTTKCQHLADAVNRATDLRPRRRDLSVLSLVVDYHARLLLSVARSFGGAAAAEAR